MYDPDYSYIDKSLSHHIYLLIAKTINTEQCLTIIIETWIKSLDQQHSVGGILTDISKALDCITHKLLIAKLEAYGFDKNALVFIYDYLTDRKQKTILIVLGKM